jgi:O-antigen ligase
MELNRKLSIWFIVAIPLLAGISTLDIEIGGLNYTGFVWAMMMPIALGLLILNRMSGTPVGRIFPAWPWLVWCAFVCISLLWTEDLSRRNVQDALQLCMPVLVAALAASAVRSRDELRYLFRSFGVTLIFLSLFTAVYVVNAFDREWMSTNVRGAAMTAALVGCVFLAEFPQRKVLPLAGWIACLIITTLTSSRMATLALLVAPLLHPCLRGRMLWKVLSLGLFAGAALTLFHTETFQQHFFQSGHGSLSDLFAGDYKDLGRFDAWTAVWEEAWHRPWLGAGVGSAYIFVPQVWQDMTHVHNDYLRVFFELGLVGLTLFVVVTIWQLLDLRRQIAASDDIVRMAFTAAWLGLCAMLISCFTDNTLVYTVLYTNPLFAVLGAAYGAAWVERQGTVEAEMLPDQLRTNALAANPRRQRRRAGLAPRRAVSSRQSFSN